MSSFSGGDNDHDEHDRAEKWKRRALAAEKRAHVAEARVEKLVDVLKELNMNANNVLAGGLGWFTRRDLAVAVADRSKAALEQSGEGEP